MLPFDLTMYKPTELEEWISDKYRAAGIYSPEDMDLDVIAEIFNCEVRYDPGKSTAMYDELYGGIIFLRIGKPETKQRMEFFHELSHPALHYGDQRKLHPLFVDMQESQAAALQNYASMPSYLIERIELVPTWREYIQNLADAFKLPYSFADKRAEQIKRRIYREHNDRNFRALTAPVKARWGYSEETLGLLDKLHNQTKERQAK
ncbi:ImmA/IrrE family metallo-endopeptidase [Paenibacillus sp. strain BS8-2]